MGLGRVAVEVVAAGGDHACAVEMAVGPGAEVRGLRRGPGGVAVDDAFAQRLGPGVEADVGAQGAAEQIVGDAGGVAAAVEHPDWFGRGVGEGDGRRRRRRWWFSGRAAGAVDRDHGGAAEGVDDGAVVAFDVELVAGGVALLDRRCGAGRGVGPGVAVVVDGDDRAAEGVVVGQVGGGGVDRGLGWPRLVRRRRGRRRRGGCTRCGCRGGWPGRRP